MVIYRLVFTGRLDVDNLPKELKSFRVQKVVDSYMLELTQPTYGEYLLPSILDGIIALRKSNTLIQSVTLWYLYEFKDQCNLEFSEGLIKQLSQASVYFCISCWESA